MINHLKDLARWLYPKPTVNYLSDHRIVLITFPQWQEIEHDREHPTIDLTCIMLKSEDSKDAKKTLDGIKPCATEKKKYMYLDWQQFHKLFTTWQWIGLQDLGLIEIIDGKIIYLY
jgi:hypothetical protein